MISLIKRAISGILIFVIATLLLHYLPVDYLVKTYNSSPIDSEFLNGLIKMILSLLKNLQNFTNVLIK